MFDRNIISIAGVLWILCIVKLYVRAIENVSGMFMNAVNVGSCANLMPITRLIQSDP